MTVGEQNEKINLTGVPETMAVRAKLLPESGRISQVAMSAMDNWGDEIKEKTAPVYKLLDKLSVVRNISNKIIVLKKGV